MEPLIGRVVRSIRYAAAASEAQSLASKRKHEAAKLVLRRVFARYGLTIPSNHVPVDLNILSANLCGWTGDLYGAYDACVVAVEQLRRPDYAGESIRLEDRKYLMFQCKWILCGLSKYIDSSAMEEAFRIEVRYADLKLNRVKQVFRRKFPMSQRDGLAVDEFIKENEAELARG